MNTTTAIIGAMPQELDTLVKTIENIRTDTKYGLTFYQGVYKGKNVVLTLSGIGKVNAAMATTIAIDAFSANQVINTGSAGGIGDGLHIGDIVIGKEIAHHDVDVTAFGYEKGQVPKMPLYFSSDKRLLSLASQAASVFENAYIHEGLIISGDSFIGSKQKIKELTTVFPKVSACEMESAAIAQVCYCANIPFVIIRAISDHANQEANMSFEAFIEHAGKRSAQMVLKILEMDD
ncbi:5'-methylthioadenosine/adenosylhomocysteine nucleosidase [Suttonella ornithocola]|uniref:5'-methylthioadenosine/S-adenosylhomocysteine nucleosidase n=1 Tax=Suttonella ornithocola TaxID=279832 RepID=A0A380MTC8_9GAMM|nr:5'-methylthioadenosine/adenosylhomocysteine nucleosidase [Suttonella ornithocola]SUO95850.1 5'-methylthioadenosine/S-adenosylhomocysteine nucleosidase [Suttonella ornithocola]